MQIFLKTAGSFFVLLLIMTAVNALAINSAPFQYEMIQYNIDLVLFLIVILILFLIYAYFRSNKSVASIQLFFIFLGLAFWGAVEIGIQPALGKIEFYSSLSDSNLIELLAIYYFLFSLIFFTGSHSKASGEKGSVYFKWIVLTNLVLSLAVLSFHFKNRNFISHKDLEWMVLGLFLLMVWVFRSLKRRTDLTKEIKNGLILFAGLYTLHAFSLLFIKENGVVLLSIHLAKIIGAVFLASVLIQDIKQEFQGARRERDNYLIKYEDESKKSGKLKSLNQQLRHILDSSSAVLIITTDHHGIITHFNKGAETISGYSAPEVVKVTTPFQFLRLVDDVKLESEHNQLSDFLYEKIPESIIRKNCTLYTRENDVKYIDLTISVFQEEYGSGQGLLLIGVDITEEFFLQKKLREKKEQYKQLSEHSPVGIMVHSGGVVRYCNLAALHILGAASGEEVIGQEVMRFVSDKYLKAVRQRMESLKNGTPIVDLIEEELIRLNGEKFYAQVMGTRIIYNNEPAIQVVFMDITEKKRMEMKLKMRDRALQESSQAMFMTDATGIITWANRACEKLTGYSPSELVGEKPSLIKSDKMYPRFYEKFWEIISAGHNWTGEFINRKKNGDIYTQHTIVTPVKNGDGEINGYICIAKDITTRKQAEIATYKREQRFSTIFNQYKEGIVLLQVEEPIQCSNILAVNNAGSLMLGDLPHNLVGKNIMEIVPGWVDETFLQACYNTYKNDVTEVVESMVPGVSNLMKMRKSRIIKIFNNELAIFFEDKSVKSD